MNSTDEVLTPDELFNKFGSSWYSEGKNYWSQQEPTMKAMLGGYDNVDDFDSQHSKKIIDMLVEKHGMGANNCVDFGSGIGRVTEKTLRHYFNNIDLVDPVTKFLEQAAINLSKYKNNFRYYDVGAQEWSVNECYDCFWVQWTLYYLTDDDVVRLLIRCKDKLKTNGYIVVKDNVSSVCKDLEKDMADFTPGDRSIARTYKHYIELFERANLSVIYEDTIDLSKHAGLEEWELMPIFTFVLK